MIGIAGRKDEADVESFFATLQTQNQPLFAYYEPLGAVVFDMDSFHGDGAIGYKIRLTAEQKSEKNSGAWRTERMFPRRASVGPRGNDSYGGYVPGSSD